MFPKIFFLNRPIAMSVCGSVCLCFRTIGWFLFDIVDRNFQTSSVGWISCCSNELFIDMLYIPLVQYDQFVGICSLLKQVFYFSIHLLRLFASLSSQLNWHYLFCPEKKRNYFKNTFYRIQHMNNLSNNVNQNSFYIFRSGSCTIPLSIIPKH